MKTESLTIHHKINMRGNLCQMAFPRPIVMMERGGEINLSQYVKKFLHQDEYKRLNIRIALFLRTGGKTVFKEGKWKSETIGLNRYTLMLAITPLKIFKRHFKRNTLCQQRKQK